MTRSKWAIAELARSIAVHFERGWNRLPAPAVRAWARTLLIGIVATFVTLGALIIYGKSRLGLGGRLPWEVELLQQIELHSPIGFSGAVWFQTFGTDIVLVLVVLTAASIAMWRERPLLGLSILLSMVLMDAAVRIGWLSWERMRPDIIAEGIARPSEHSFPSGHTAKSLAVYGLLISQWIRSSRNIIEKVLAALILLVIAVGTPFGRVRMGVHWPTDVLGGWTIGSIWLAFLYFALKKAEQKQFVPEAAERKSLP